MMQNKRTASLVVALLSLGGAGAGWYFHGRFAEQDMLLRPVAGGGRGGPDNMAWIPAGAFIMGSEHKLAQPNERPAHKVRLSGFWMDTRDVTNADFRRFVQATAYVTSAERKPDWDDLKVQLPPGASRPDDAALVPGAMVFVGTSEPVSLRDYSRWWRLVPGANWQHPQGPDSDIDGKDEHPVVQVSHDDAQAYARWAGKRLPSEAQWEFAARGGLDQATYAWGNAPPSDGGSMANIWDDKAQPFPVVSDVKVRVGTTPVASFEPNAYGLYDMAGNVWQWVGDWYRADYFEMQARNRQEPTDPTGPSDSFDPDEPGVPSSAPKRVTRGGSFLCSETYCLSYRTSARRGIDPMNSMSHVGFRLVMTAQQWEAASARPATPARR